MKREQRAKADAATLRARFGDDAASYEIAQDPSRWAAARQQLLQKSAAE